MKKGYSIAYQLVDTIGASGNAGEVLSQNQYAVPKNAIRLGAHTISDEVLKS